MVLLHGSNASGARMRPLAEAFAQFTQPRAPNLIGHGGRPVPERFSIPEFAADVVEWLDREGIDRTFITGYSIGGYIALYLARHHPARVRGASDQDPLVPWAETAALSHLIPGSHLAMFHGPAHPLRAVPVLAVARTIWQWVDRFSR